MADTIYALSSGAPPAGIGVIRISGPLAGEALSRMANGLPPPRSPRLRIVRNGEGAALDQALVMWFAGPNTATGEDLAEIHCHGGRAVVAALLAALSSIDGLREAEPGEFTRRAFENGKMDLTEAEGLADLVEAETAAQRRQALRQMDGALGQIYDRWRDALLTAIARIEAEIDFAEEDLPAGLRAEVTQAVVRLDAELAGHLDDGGRGQRLRDGVSIAILGPPNAGKSSLLNALAGRESAIVTDIAGTTRDILREHIHIDGMPLHIIDTAGLRDTDDQVEQIGVQRAMAAIGEADRILLMVDASQPEAKNPELLWPEFLEQRPDPAKVTLIYNKVDVTGEPVAQDTAADGSVVLHLSSRQGEGIDLLREHLKACMGFEQTGESLFSARRRHLEALEEAASYLQHGFDQLTLMGAGELLAEDLRMAQQALGKITGEFSADDLLGRIFSSFCIGK